VRHGFSKFGGNLGTSGSVSYLFEKTGSISFALGSDEEKVLEISLEAGADDVLVQDDGSLDVMTSPENFGSVKDALAKAGLVPVGSEVAMLASTEVELDYDTAEKLLRLVDHLEDLDDVQNVYSNANISNEIMNKL
jgi:transcriptional/translational regulatory protein YebC/TACO1